MGTGIGVRRSQQVEDLIRRFRPLADQLTALTLARVPRSVDRAELHSAAMFGLFQAAQSWDGDRGVSFEAFARHRIRGALLDELRGRDWASRRVRSFARAVAHAAEQLTAEHGRQPTDTEIAERLAVPVSSIARLERDLHRAAPQSTEPYSEESGFADPTDEGPEESLERRERNGYLHDAVALLPERLRRVVLGYYVDELPMLTLAEELGVTESRISQMRSEAVKLLRAALAGALSGAEELALGGHGAERGGCLAADLARSRSDARERLGLRLVS